MARINLTFSSEFGENFWEKASSSKNSIDLPWRMLKEQISMHAEIVTSKNKNENTDIAIGFNCIPTGHVRNKYLVLMECPSITSEIYKDSNLNQANTIFSWSPELIKKYNAKKLYFPQFFPKKIKFKNESRKKFACIISANKNTKKKSLESLYHDRVETIQWFEKNSPTLFDLFGRGWKMPALSHGPWIWQLQKIVGKIGTTLGVIFFPSYQGEIADKYSTLLEYKFNFCYENASSYNGYITEKIFDSFFAGCIPIYWGAPDIDQYIPADCYIDRRQFSSHEELLHHLQGISEQDFIGYQERIRNFLQSDAAKPFSAEYFANTITKQILQDLGIPA